MQNWGNTCLACRIITGDEPVAGGVIYREEFWVVTMGLLLLKPGWVVVASHIHHPSVGDLSVGAQESMGRVLTRTTASVKHAFGAEAVYICSFGETVAHVHFHIIPRLPEDTLTGPALVTEMFARKEPCMSWEDAEEDAARLRTAFTDVVPPMSHLPPPAPVPRDKLQTSPDVRETGPRPSRTTPNRYAPYDRHDDD